MKDEKLRWSCTQLLDHEFVRLSDGRVDVGGWKKTRITDLDAAGMSRQHTDADTAPYDDLNLATDVIGPSRLTREFDVMEWLGKGAFGDVMKVQTCPLNFISDNGITRLIENETFLCNKRSRHVNKGKER